MTIDRVPPWRQRVAGARLTRLDTASKIAVITAPSRRSRRSGLLGEPHGCRRRQPRFDHRRVRNVRRIQSALRGLTQQQLITKIYQQALNRAPDPAGLAYYIGELQAGRKTLQTITLDVLNGATTPPDSTTIADKLAVADYFTAWVAGGCAYGGEQLGVDTLQSVTSVASTVAAARATIEARCLPANAVNPAQIQDSYPLHVLNFELPNLIGRTVWVMGYYGNRKIDGDGVGFLVDNALRLEVNEVFPHHSFARLDGNLPPADWQGSEVLVRGTIMDYAQAYGVSAVDPTPLVTGVEIQRTCGAARCSGTTSSPTC